MPRAAAAEVPHRAVQHDQHGLDQPHDDGDHTHDTDHDRANHAGGTDDANEYHFGRDLE